MRANAGRAGRTRRWQRGYRNGSLEWTITAPEGTRRVTVPRGRIAGTDGRTTEFHSQLLPRYARRTREIDEAILSCYLGGVNPVSRLDFHRRPPAGVRLSAGPVSDEHVRQVVLALHRELLDADGSAVYRIVPHPVGSTYRDNEIVPDFLLPRTRRCPNLARWSSPNWTIFRENLTKAAA
jgi:Transposase, Mutator family